MAEFKRRNDRRNEDLDLVAEVQEVASRPVTWVPLQSTPELH